MSGKSNGNRAHAFAHDIIVAGASSGGVEALMWLAQGLPADFPAAIFVVLHIPPDATSILPELLSRAGPLPAAHATDGESIHPGRFYIAPPDHHLIVETGCVRLSSGPRENHVRPAVDPLFRSAALAYGPRVIGVVLSGELSDGTAGLWDIKHQGGVAVVQDPGDAAYPSMPHSALDQVPVDYLLPLADIPGLLIQLTGEPAREALGEGVQTAAMSIVDDGPVERKPGSAAVARDMAHGDNLLKGYTEDIEHSLWHVVSTLCDRVNLTRQFAIAAREGGKMEAAARYEQRAYHDEEQAAAIRQMIGAGAAVNR